MTNLVTLTVHSTHFYLIDCLGGKLLVDAGWELDPFTRQLKTYKIAYREIRYILFTHHHPDHAGLVQEVKELSGARLIIHEKQIPYLQNLEAYIQKKGGYKALRVEKQDLVSPNRAALQAIGIDGEIVETPGHSDDSISLALDSGSAMIGDLTSPWMVTPETAETVRASWQRLLDRKIQWFYHSHTDPIPAEQVIKGLQAF